MAVGRGRSSRGRARSSEGVCGGVARLRQPLERRLSEAGREAARDRVVATAHRRVVRRLALVVLPLPVGAAPGARRHVNTSTRQQVNMSKSQKVKKSVKKSKSQKVKKSKSQRVNMSPSQQVNMSTCQRVNKSTSQHVNKSTSQQDNMSTSQQANRSTCQQVNKATSHSMFCHLAIGSGTNILPI